MYSGIPANSPGFPESLQVFHEISRSPGQSTNLPGTTYRGSFYISYSLISQVMYCYYIEKSEIQKKKKKRSANKNGSHFENFLGCLQICVLWGLAGMQWSFQCWYMILILTYLNFRPPFWRRVYSCHTRKVPIHVQQYHWRLVFSFCTPVKSFIAQKIKKNKLVLIILKT